MTIKATISHRATGSTPVTSPLRPLRLLVEDPALTDDLTSPAGAVEITVCPGPGDGEICPLVVEGVCPMGPCDVVVSALDGEWAGSVRAAWAETGTPYVEAGDLAGVDPAARLRHHTGAALQRLWT